MTNETTNKWDKFLPLLALGLVGLGVFFRFFRITQNDFFFYDEGYYLILHRKFLEIIAYFPKRDFANFMGAMDLCLRLALGTGKALWFFISSLRVFWGGLEDWYFPKLVSALTGSLTAIPIFFFAKRYFNSVRLAWLSVVLLAILPSHVFYSRLGLQEAMCTFFFLYGFYFYVFPERFGLRTFISAAVFVLAYFLNYRLIILPVFVLFCECYMSFSQKRKPDVRKYFWHTLIFYFLVFAIGSLDNGSNTVVTFSWMFYQAGLAENHRNIFSFLSYPYFFFRFEGLIMAALFFANIYFLLRKEWRKAFFFCIVCVGMLVFSFTADKAARYLCVMLPFFVLAAVSFLDYLWEVARPRFKNVITILFMLLTISLLTRSYEVTKFHSDYRAAADYIKQIDAKSPLIISSQFYIMTLYLKESHVMACPKDFLTFVRMYRDGYRYLILDPQAYVSRTLDGNKFTPHLMNYLQFIVSNIQPIKVFPHLSEKMLERFVFEHNDDFKRSLEFLSLHQPQLREIRIYDIKTCIDTINQRVAERQKRH